MSDYKSTLNLPKTEFAMKANLAEREPACLARWESIQLYQQLQDKGKGCEKFILHDGPPYANGHIHIGHAVNKILKDIIVKSKRMSDFDAPYVPGWDCHGLPIELNVEKKHGKAGGKLSPQAFRSQCRAYAASQVDIQREEFKRLGVLGDWEHPYLTMNYHYEADIVRALAKMIERGHLVQGAKPVYWCLDCRSALAEAEVEYDMKRSMALDVSFRVLNESEIISRLSHAESGVGSGDIIVPIWTTTPWTLPANQAVALNPNLDYALVYCQVESQSRRYLIAQALITDVMARWNIDDYRVVAYGQGAALEGILLAHPFLQKEVPVILGDHVNTEAGTGCVHTAPAHGLDDYHAAERYHIAMETPLGDNGCFNDSIPQLAGLHLNQANDKIVEWLKACGTLLCLRMIDHSYPHCWRHKTPVIFRATPQWFISMDNNNLRADALEAIRQVAWIPEWGMPRITAMIENRPDWCISRQRAWGTPIPLFVHKDTGELHPDTLTLLEKIAVLIEAGGVDVWFDLEAEALIGDDSHQYRKIEDTLDVWFDSGVSHHAVLHRREELCEPADLYLEGSDQHRGWFQAALLTMIAMHGTAPYYQVLTHGFTVDADGHKMSKSRGNVVAPEQVMKTYGADVLRLWVAATDYRSELSISDEILKRIADAYRRIRNTSRFLLANLFDFNPDTDQVAYADLLDLDRWAIDFTAELQEKIIANYDAYQFHQIYQDIHHFCAVEMGSFYLDIIKDRQYTCQTNSLARRSCQTAMFYILECLVRWLAPILSFTAEEIWLCLPGKREDSVHVASWFPGFKTTNKVNQWDARYWQMMMMVRDGVNKTLEEMRGAGTLGSGLEAEVTLYCQEPLLKSLLQLEDELRFVLITSRAIVKPLSEKPADATESLMSGLWISVEVSNHSKCERCWHRREDVGQTTAHPTLCGRCVENVAGAGEKRCHA